MLAFILSEPEKLSMVPRSALVYGLVSGICLVLHNAIMIAGDRIGWTLATDIIVSFIFVALTGYILHSMLTFREGVSLSRFLRYAFAMSANIPMAFLATLFWRKFAGLDMIFASPIATACMVIMNYFLSQWAIATPKKSDVVK